VRRARPGDAPAVGEVQMRVWGDAFGGVLRPEVLGAFRPEYFAEAWEGSLREPPTPRHVLLVAHEGGAITGLVALGPTDDPDGDDETAELLVLGVDPARRRRGHGSRLVNAAVDTARELGFTWLTAWVPQPLQGARDFLASAGMGPDGARRERVVDADDGTLTEFRLAASLTPPEDDRS